MTRQKEFARKDSAQAGGIFGFFIVTPGRRARAVTVAGAMTAHFCDAAAAASQEENPRAFHPFDFGGSSSPLSPTSRPLPS